MSCLLAFVAFFFSLFCAGVNAIPTITAVGSKFFTSEGNQFYIKGKSLTPTELWKTTNTSLHIGVAYQLVEDDPLVNTTQCQLDASLMKQLGANSIRVYHVDPSADHSGCMNAFAQNNIYIWVDMDSFKTYIQFVWKIYFRGETGRLTRRRRAFLRGQRTNPTRIELSWTTSSSTTTLPAFSWATRCSTPVRD